jgi:N-acetylglucosaminyldiphosphoundecaprenol N-acetyl-beta-D-mannosaminyltransferase
VVIADKQTQENPAHLPRPLNILGVPVAPFETYDQVLTCVEEAVEAHRKAFCVAVNPIKVYRAWYEPDLLRLLRQADVNICDGVGISIASRILHGRLIKRITGCDLFFRLLSLACRRQWGVYLLGASAQSNAAARMTLQRSYPNLRIVGWHDGYFEDSAKVVEYINASGAHAGPIPDSRPTGADGPLLE